MHFFVFWAPKCDHKPGDKFAAVQGTNSAEPETVWLVSDTIPCQSGNGTLAFALWKSAIPPAVHVCIQKPPTSNTLTCMHKVNGFAGAAWTAQTFNIPIVLMAFVQLSSDFMGLDMLVYMADLNCANNHRDDVPVLTGVLDEEIIVPVNSPKATTTEPAPIVPQTSSVSNTNQSTIIAINNDGVRRAPSVPSGQSQGGGQPDRTTRQPQVLRGIIKPLHVPTRDNNKRSRISAPSPGEDSDRFPGTGLGPSIRQLAGASSDCSMIECDFEQSLCDFEAYRLDNEAATMRFLCEPLTHNKNFIGAPQGSCFLAMTTVRDVPLIQVLASRPFFLHEPAHLHFRYFVPNDGSGMVMICLNVLQDCVWRASRPRRGLEMWWSRSLQLPAGKTQLFIVLQQDRKGTRVAIDNLRVRRKGYPGSVVQCMAYSDYDYPEQKDETNSDHAPDQWDRATAPEQRIEYTDGAYVDYYDHYEYAQKQRSLYT